MLHAPNSGLRLERERGTKLLQLTSKLFFIRKTFNFCHHQTAQKIICCTRISSQSSDDQPFSCCTNWASDSLSLSLSLSAFFLSHSHSLVKVKSPPPATCTSCHDQPKGDGRQSWSSSQFSLDVQTSSTSTHFNVVYDTTLFLIRTRTHASGSLGRVVNQ